MPVLDAAGVRLIQGFESCVLTAYWDPIGQCWTIGWGSTGPDIHEGLVWTQAQADARFESDIARFDAAVQRLVTIELTPNEFAALVSFQYNTGGLANSPGLELINQHDFPPAWDDHFRLWVHDAEGNVIEGLVRRRAAEEALFFTPG